ncbi:hypothetical protein LMG26840_03012 [Achromobacter dolens]|nr:hypothetical protein LMG26840_03012 [Achromobacter dolens]
MLLRAARGGFEDMLHLGQAGARGGTQRLGRFQHVLHRCQRLADGGRRRAFQQLRHRLQHGGRVQPHHHGLVAGDVLEFLQRHGVARLGAHLADQREAALVQAALGAGHVQQHADGGHAQAAFLQQRAQFGGALFHEAAVFRRHAGVAARLAILAAQPGQVLHQRRAVDAHEGALVGRIAQFLEDVQAGLDQLRKHLLGQQERVVGRYGLPMLPHLLGHLRDRRDQRIAVGHQLIRQAQRVQALAPFGRLRRHQGAHPRLHEAAVHAQVDVGDAGHGGKAQVVVFLALDDGAHVVHAALLERQHVVAVGQVGVGRVRRLVGDLGLVDAGRQHIDHVDVGGEFLVFLARHAAGHEDAQVADALMHGIDDGLVVRQHLGVVLVQVRDPAQRLRRRGDVVALGAEHHDRRADVAQVDADAVGRDQPGGRQAVADEQVVDDVLDFRPVQEHVAAPPFLEAEVTAGLGVDLGVQVVLLGPERVGGVEVLEVLHQPGAVELAVAQVAGQGGEPTAAEQAAGVAHRVHAAPAGPVGQRRAGDDDGAEQLGTHGGGHHDLPAGLAVGHHHRLALGVGVTRDDFFQEMGLGLHHVFDGLGGHGLRQEGGEVAGMAGAHRHADLALGLEAADAGAVAGAWVDHQEGALDRIDRHALGRLDAQQAVVDRARQFAAVQHQFVLHAEHVGGPLGHMLVVLVAALAHDVGVQHAALPGVHGVFIGGRPGVEGRGGDAIVAGSGHGDLL